MVQVCQFFNYIDKRDIIGKFTRRSTSKTWDSSPKKRGLAVKLLKITKAMGNFNSKVYNLSRKLGEEKASNAIKIGLTLESNIRIP